MRLSVVPAFAAPMSFPSVQPRADAVTGDFVARNSWLALNCVDWSRYNRERNQKLESMVWVHWSLLVSDLLRNGGGGTGSGSRKSSETALPCWSRCRLVNLSWLRNLYCSIGLHKLATNSPMFQSQETWWFNAITNRIVKRVDKVTELLVLH